MTGNGIVEAVSYKFRRIKVRNSWLSVNPFIDLQLFRIGINYTYELKLENGQWYIDTFTEENTR